MVLGSHHERVWRELAEAVGGRFEDEQGWSGDRVEAGHEGWRIVVDLHPLPGFLMQHVLLRFRAAVRLRDRFRFELHRNGPLEQLADVTGLDRLTTDLKVGDGLFDRHFTVYASDGERFGRVLRRMGMVEEMERAGDLRMSLGGAWGLDETLPAGVGVLRLETSEKVRSLERLRQFYDLMAGMLEALSEEGAIEPPAGDAGI
jgi:hypothetical protein